MGNFESLAVLIAVFGIFWALDRKNFKREGLFLLRRTTRWLKVIDSFAKKHKKLIDRFSDAGVVASFGLLGVSYLARQKKYTQKQTTFLATKYLLAAFLIIFLMPGLFSGLITIFHIPPAYATLVLYFFKAMFLLFGFSGYSFFMILLVGLGSTLTAITGGVPESGLKLVLPFSVPEKYEFLPVYSLPLIPWIVSIFIILVVHEFSHAIVARREGIRVKSMGYGFFGPLPLGFAEPDEKQIYKAASIKKTRIFAAGSWSNMLTGALMIIMLIPMSLGAFMLTDKYSYDAGVGYTAIDLESAAEILPPIGVITEINGVAIGNYTDYQNVMTPVNPGDAVRVVINSTTYNLFAQEDSINQSRAILGFLTKDMYVSKEFDPEHKGGPLEYLLLASNYILMLFETVITLSIGIALFNLLPIKPLDGGLMMEEVISVKNAKKRKKIVSTISLITFLLILYALFGPALLNGLI